MIKNTKFIALLLALSLAAAACGGSSDDASEADSSSDDTTATTAATEEEAIEDDEATEDDEAIEDDEAMEEVGTIVDVAAEAGSFTTLLAAAEAAGLVETLSGEGPLTVFAPTDDAFAAALADLGLTAEELLADTETLTSILTYHVVAGEVLSGDLTDGMTAVTVNGAEITVDLTDGVKINGATVTTADIKASNGVIHVIDQVLLP
jgi:transforming growth factor-beta-induced protein